jgi:hypothetical protein
MANTRWKKTERAIAQRLGGERVPVPGRARGSAPDIAHDWLCPEVKHRKSIPLWLLQAVSQAQAAARGDQLPVVVVHQHGARHADNLVILKMSDFVDNFGPCPSGEREG